MCEMIAAWILLSGGERFFERREVDFWGTRRRPEAPALQDLWPDSNAPPIARKLLEEPTREHAEAYLAWQEQRMRKLQAALSAVEEAKRASPILYFTRPGCRYCDLQDAELEGLPVRRVPPGSPLWKEHEVTATPTLVVAGRAFRGFTPRAALLRELGRE